MIRKLGRVSRVSALKRIRVPYWGLIRCAVGKERFAAGNIDKRGAPYGGRSFIPRIKKDYSPVLKPLFPGYVFVWIDQTWSYLHGCPGVIQVLMSRGKPGEVQNSFMDQLLAAQGDEGYIDLSPAIYQAKPGEMVRAKVGLFKTHLVRYIGLTPDDRIRAAIDFMGTEQEVIYRKRDIEKA